MIRRILALLAALMLVAGFALADEEMGSIAETACSIVRSEDYYLVYCYARVHNNTDEIICLDEGTFSLLDGEQALCIERVTRLWPYFINPGEDGYLFDVVAFEPNEDGVVVPHVTGIDFDLNYMSVPIEHASYELTPEASIDTEENGSVSVSCLITNNTQITAFEPTITIGLYAQNGRMVYADGMTLENVGIPAGQSAYVRFDVNDEFMEQWTSYGMSPENVHVNAIFRQEED